MRNTIMAGGIAMFALAACMTPQAVAPEQPPPAAAPEASTLSGTYLGARVAMIEGDIDAAATLYGDLLEADPDNSDLLSRAFLYAATAGRMEEAIPLAERVVLRDPRNRPAHLLLASAALIAGDYDTAEDEIARSGGGAFSTLTNAVVRAWAFAGQRRADRALEALESLAGQTGVAGLRAFHEALILEYAGDPEEASEAYERSAALVSGGPRSTDAYGRFLRRNGRFAEASAVYRQMAQQAPGAPVAEIGLEETAARRRPAPLINNPAEGAAEGLFAIAASLNGEQGGDVAILYLNLAIYLRPDFELARALLGERYERQQKFAEANRLYAEVSRDSPYYAMLEVQSAVNQGRLGDDDGAIARMEALTRARPEDTDAWTALGDLRRSADRDEAAARAYDAAIEQMEPGDGRLVGLYFARGICLQNLGRWDEAEADFQRSLAINPNRADVLNYLGYSWVEQRRNLDEAVELLEKARSLRPLDGYIADSVGWAYYQLGRYEEAAEILEQAVQLAPGASEINDHLGDAYWRIGRKLDASFEWNHALSLEPEAATRPLIEEKLRLGLDAAQASGS